MGWNALASTRAVRAPRRARRRGRLLRAQLRRRAGRTTVAVAEVEHGGADRRRGRVRPARGRPVPPRAERRRGRARARERDAMVKKRVIPCLDVAGGRVVKGVRFESLRDVGDPVELATRYSELGADELVFLDITATIEGRGPMLELVERAAEQLTIPFTVGGGVSGLEDARALLRAGADKVAVNRAAVDDPAILAALAEEFGAQAVVCAIDARAGEVVTHGGRTPRGLDAVEWAARAADARRGRDPAHLDRRRRDARGLRPRADARRSRRRERAGDRVRRRRRGAASRRGVRRRRRGRADRLDRARAARAAAGAEARAEGGGMERPD